MAQDTGQKLRDSDETANRIGSTIRKRLFEFKRRFSHELRTLGLSAAVTATAFVTPVAAQSGLDGAESVMCGAGGGPNLGRIVMIVLALFAMLFVFKAVFEGMGALDKMNSPREQEHLEGKEGLKSAGTTLGAALVPVLAGPFLELIGLNTISCIDWSLGIMMIAPF